MTKAVKVEERWRSDGAAITRGLAGYVVGSRFEDIPTEVRREGVRSLINFMGCSVAGSRHETVEAALAALKDLGAGGEAVVLGRSERLDPMNAALINGISSAVLDFDATQFKRTNIHPSGPVLPPLLAFMTSRSVSGGEFLHAYILAVEVACRLANGIFGEQNPGWHVTGATGGIGAAAGVGRLLGLSLDKMAAGFGIAATQAGGLREMYGTMCKSFTPGRTAQNGYLAALLAARGFDSAEHAIEGDKGLAMVMTGRPAEREILHGLGERFEIMHNIYKPFACAIVSHAAIDGALRLRKLHGFTAETVDRVHLLVSPPTLALAGKRDPRTGLESKFSVYHGVALALRYGDADPRRFEDGYALDPALAGLRARVTAETDARLAKDQAEVIITLADGRELKTRVEHAVGSLVNPMSDADLDDKFRGLCEDALPKQKIERLLELCRDCERLADASVIAATAAA
ncbi:MAG TPA: MmgE/PrpD family protein [Xanthobacteraceae bacterium]|nr:MmgE/PrpD family protein [Xanthobacteraceae bacterium]